MANWKKIIVSGSNAELTEITASSGLKFRLAPHIASGGLQGNAATTPLVVDSDGNVHTGSAYALASGGNTVGGSNLTSDIALVGGGDSLIKSASSANDVDFNNTSLKNITNLTASNAVINNVYLGTSTNHALAFKSSSNSTLQIPSSNGFEGFEVKIPVTMSNVPDGGNETDILVIGPNGEVMQRPSSELGGVTSVDGGTNLNNTADSNTGAVTINLNDDISLTKITASGDIFFSASGATYPKNYRIDYAKVYSASSDVLVPSSGSLTITASGLQIRGDLDASGSVTLDGALSFNGFNFTQTNVTTATGSTFFGSGSTGAEVQATTHQFTGSILVTGSGITLTDGIFTGDGSGLENIVASNVQLQTLKFGDGLNGANSSYNGTSVATMSLKLDGTTLETSSNGLKVKDSSIGTDQLANNSIIGTKLSSSLISDISTELTDFTTIDSTDELLISDGGTLKKVDASVFKDYISQSLINVFSDTDTTFDLKATHSIGTTDTVIRLIGSNSTTDDVKIIGSTSEIDVTLDDANNKITIGLPNDVTIANDLTVTTDLDVNGAADIAGNLVVQGDLTVEGNTTTISTQDLVVEDRFIYIGSGSSTNQDVGIVFSTGSITNTSGLAIIHDASNNRLSTAKGVDAPNGEETDNISSNKIIGDLVTVKHGQLSAPNSTSASFGVGEMYITNTGDIYIYSD